MINAMIVTWLGAAGFSAALYVWGRWTGRM